MAASREGAQWGFRQVIRLVVSAVAIPSAVEVSEVEASALVVIPSAAEVFAAVVSPAAVSTEGVFPAVEASMEVEDFTAAEDSTAGVAVDR